MQIPVIRRNRGFLPGGTPRINWKNPLTEGLLYCYLPGAGGGNVVPNLAGFGCNLVGAANYKTVPTKEGSAGYGNATHTDLISNEVPVFTPTTAATCLWRGINLGLDIGDRVLCGICNPAENPRSITISQFSTNDYLIYWTPTDNSFHKSGDYRPAVDNSIISLAGTFQSGGNCLTYVNGKSVITSSYGSSLSLNYVSTTRIMMAGTSAVGSGQSAVNSLMGCIWNRVLSPLEMSILHNDPYQFFIYPEDYIFAQLIGVTTFAPNQPHKPGVAG